MNILKSKLSRWEINSDLLMIWFSIHLFVGMALVITLNEKFDHGKWGLATGLALIFWLGPYVLIAVPLALYGFCVLLAKGSPIKRKRV